MQSSISLLSKDFPSVGITDIFFFQQTNQGWNQLFERTFVKAQVYFKWNIYFITKYIFQSSSRRFSYFSVIFVICKNLHSYEGNVNVIFSFIYLASHFNDRFFKK